MAFRPLDFFRIKKRTTKILLAVLGIICMFLFVVGDVLFGRSSGGGTGLGRTFRRWFGTTDYVAKVHTQTLDEHDLRELSKVRQAVWQFALNVQASGRFRAFTEAGFTEQEAAAAIQIESDPFSSWRMPQDLQQSVAFKRMEFQKKHPDSYRALQESRMTLSAGLFQADAIPGFATPEDLVEFVIWKKKADELGIVLSPQHVQEDLLRSAANRFDADQLPGLARQLKIRLDVEALLLGLGDELRVMIARGAILGVRQGDMFGFGVGGERLSVQLTPLDLWDAYVKVKTRLTVGILPIAVNRKEFLSQVKEPAAAELKEFFNKYKDQSPSANRDTPGFKVPELYQLEFIYADLRTNDHYRKWAEAIRALDPAGFYYRVLDHYMDNRHRYRTVDPFAVLVSGDSASSATYYKAPLPLGPGPWATVGGVRQQKASELALGLAALAGQGPLPPLGFVAVLQPGAEKLPNVQAQPLEVANLAMNAGFGLPGLLGYPPRFLYTEKYEPLEQHFAAIADEIDEQNRRLALEGDLKQLQRDLEDYSKEYQKALAKWKQQQRSRNKPLYGPGAATFEPPLFVVKKDTQKKPDAEAKPTAKPQAESKTENKPQAQSKTENKPQAEKADAAKEKEERIPIQEHLKRFAAGRGLLLEGMAELRSREDLFKETGKSPLGSILKPVFVELEEAFLRRFRASSSYDHERFNETLARELTDASGPYEPKQAQAPSDSRGPGPRLRGEKQWTYAVYWKSAQTEARTPTFEEAQTSVYPGWMTPAEAWKLDKARELAKQRAEALAKEVAQSKPDGYRKLKDLEDYRDEQVLARFEESLDITATAGPQKNYRPATPPVIEKPTGDLLDEALSKLKEKGDALVVHDRPKSHYYVIVLKGREEPRAANPEALTKFDGEVITPDRPNQLQVNHRPISDYALQERQREFIANWEKGLREKADYKVERGRQMADGLRQLITDRP